MDQPRPTRWRRGLAMRRESTRRMLAAGAFIGLVAGLVSLAMVDGVSDDLRDLVRLAMLLPVAIFVGWWLMGPGIAVDRDEVEANAEPSIDVDERVSRIQQAFDASAVPRMGEHRVEPTDAAVRDELRRSIRRPDGSTTEAAAAYGIRRPERDLG